jgi:hypothetical protein
MLGLRLGAGRGERQSGRQQQAGRDAAQERFGHGVSPLKHADRLRWPSLIAAKFALRSARDNLFDALTFFRRSRTP